MAETKIHDDTNVLSSRHGNGVLRREVWVDESGKVVRYNLAYINHDIYQQDHGRVIGYDNAHGYHHRHYLGQVESVDFVSFEDVEERFAADWSRFRSKK